MTTTTWHFDTTHSSIAFSVRHLLVAKVRGRFQTWNGALQLDEKDLTKSSVAITIDASSVDTNEAKRDAHLRSPDFFDVEHHPTVTFVSSRVEVESDERLRVTGDLTIRGVTQPVTLEVEVGGVMKQDPWGQRRAGFSAHATIDRKAFGVSWNQALDHGGLALGDKVTLASDVEAVRPADVASGFAAA